MKRKDFISQAGSSLLAMSALSRFTRAVGDAAPDEKTPAMLKPGDTIALTSPAGFISLDDCRPAIKMLKDWGFNVKVGSTIGKKYFGFGGTDEERLADFQDLLDDPMVAAILCGRGGYGMVRIIDRLNFTAFRARPKWLLGFSDITVLLNYVETNYSVASIHCKMCNSFPANPDAIQTASLLSIHDLLTGKQTTYQSPVNPFNRPGSARGILTGGNLRTIESMIGTRGEIDTKNKILFLEETDEYIYNVDRMLRHLDRAGKFAHLRGLVIGNFKIKPDDDGEPFGADTEEIVTELVKPYHFPVCFNFPVGHQKENYALGCGLTCRLTVTSAGGELSLTNSNSLV